MELEREQLKEIQALGEYRAALKSLRRPGVLGIIFGAAAVLGGSVTMHHDPVNVGLFIIGAAQLIVGVWHVTAPSLNGLAANGVLMIVIGAWNTFVTVYASGTAVMIDIVGLVQIGYGVHALGKYKNLRGKFPQPPSAETIRFIDELVRHVSRLKPKESDDVIEFESKPFVGRRRRWKGLLLRDAAIFATRQHDVLCGTRLGVTITLIKKLLLQKAYKAVLGIGGDSHKGTISKRSLERFEAWKARPAEAAPGAASEGIPDEAETDSDSDGWSVPHGQRR